MDWVWLGALVGFPGVWHLVGTGFAYVDAPKYGMNPRKWATVAFLVPLFGLFCYLFARDERVLASTDDRTVDTPYQMHASRADERHDELPDER